MDLAITTDRKGLKILPRPNVSVPLLLLSSHRTESGLNSAGLNPCFQRLFPKYAKLE